MSTALALSVGEVYRVPSLLPEGYQAANTPPQDYVVTADYEMRGLAPAANDEESGSAIDVTKLGDERVIKGFGHAMRVFGKADTLHASLAVRPPEARVIDFMADAANVRAFHEQSEVSRRVALANLTMLTAIRDANRALLKDVELANPIDAVHPETSVLLTLAKATHDSWLAVEKQAASYVPYTSELHDVVTVMVHSGAILHAPGGKVVTVEDWNNPRKKFKIKPAQIDWSKVDEPTKERFDAIVGENRKGYMINTVAGEWQDLFALTGDSDWQKIRPGFLYGLQADSVAAVYASLCRPEVWGPLEAALKYTGHAGFMDGRAQDAAEAHRDVLVRSALVDILRAVNLSWRVNNPWSGWNSPLQNRPFGLDDIGGIGLNDILKDAVVLQAILEGLNQARVAGQLNLKPELLARLETAFTHGLAGYLAQVTNPETLERAVKENQSKYV